MSALLLVYPWSGFKPSFMKKDVGVFPYACAKKHGLVFNTSILGDGFNKGVKILFVLETMFKIFFLPVKKCVFFHVGYKNLLFLLVLRVFKKDVEIVLKTDLNAKTSSGYYCLGFFRFHLYRLIISLSDVVVVETLHVYELLIGSPVAFGFGERIILMNNGVEVDFDVDSVSCREKFGRISVVVITRSDSEDKRAERIVDIIRLMKESSGYSISVYGAVDDEVVKACNLLSYDSDLAVNFYGEVSKNDVISKLVSSDIFVCFSDQESYCFALVEAACCNNYIVTTDVGVAKDLERLYKNIVVLNKWSSVEAVEKILAYKRCCNSSVELNEELIKYFSWDGLLERSGV